MQTVFYWEPLFSVFYQSLVTWRVINYLLNVLFYLKLEKKKSNLSKTLKGLVKNKPLIWILIASLLFMMCIMLIGAVNVYLFKDYFRNAAALSIVGIIQTVAIFVAIPLVKPL